METLISLLRGVNITGHNSINMTDLAALYSDHGFIKPETYIQSGNVIFSIETELPVAEISYTIELAIHDTFGYDIPVIIRTVSEMRNLLL